MFSSRKAVAYLAAVLALSGQLLSTRNKRFTFTLLLVFATLLARAFCART